MRYLRLKSFLNSSKLSNSSLFINSNRTQSVYIDCKSLMFRSNELSLCSVCSVQVIVMSGHETIRVLEVEVDASLPSSATDDKGESKAAEEVAQAAGQPEAGGPQDISTLPQNTGTVGKSRRYCTTLVGWTFEEHVKKVDTPSYHHVNKCQISVNFNPGCTPAVAGEQQQVVSVEAPTPAIQTLTPAAPVSVSLPQPQAAMPIAVQGCPQVSLQIYTLSSVIL